MTGTDLFDAKEAARRLGISESHLRALMARRKIKYAKVGRCVRFTDRFIEDAIQKMTVQAT